ncbi:Glutamine amidotransferase domain [Trypanosoma vivax]|nr:putative glucosamine-fructose-6-phosphate aminotransferase [Trypanosoma vivax]KAH8613052.1 Glutamine amidotransferase domain [Trypanosoma vivax]KAH8613100.1 Glutamine amidotransferase domain [Trypanosoma vivax]
MCGIFAYINYKIPRTFRDICEILLDGLQRIEYRGYDSAGICVDNPVCETIVLIRNVGNISDLRKRVFGDKLGVVTTHAEEVFDVHVGVAHTRWATHGVPSESNSHPQVSNDQSFIVVHNGIVTNFMPIKQELLEEGYNFTSSTDTEVIAVLAEQIFKKDPTVDLLRIATEIVKKAEGTYALLIKSTHFPGELVGCMCGSPLVVGFQQGSEASGGCGGGVPLQEMYFSSDVNSFLPRTNKVSFLEEGDIVLVRQGFASFYNFKDGAATPVTRAAKTVAYTSEGLSKGQYTSFMLKEIHEQPESVTRCMQGRVNMETGLVAFDDLSEDVLAGLRGAECIRLIACGTSLHSCVAARPIFEELLPDKIIIVENALDLLDRHPNTKPGDACIFVSQSGETADTLAALHHYKKQEVVLVGVSNVPESTLLRLVDAKILLNVGVEVSVASTKAYTSQIVVLTLVALVLNQGPRGASQTSYGNLEAVKQRRAEILDGLSLLSTTIATCLNSVDGVIKQLANRWKDIGSLLILGRGYDHATALESALKVKELSYIFAEGIHAGELKHGSLTLVDEQSFVIVFCSHDRFLERSMNAIQQVRARGGNVVAVTNAQPSAELLSAGVHCIQVPTIIDCLQGVVNVVPLQLFAHHLAVIRGLNVDCPRNLAKSVTVE